MTLSGYTDSADGASLLAGEYGVVIGSLAAHGVRFKLDEIAASTNLCVAYIKTHDWSAAHPACDEAIRFAKLEAPDWQAGRASARAEHIAIAYSNRAVLEWLEDRTAAAADDLAKAYALAPQSAPVAQNLAKLGRGDLLGARAPTHGTAATSAATHG